MAIKILDPTVYTEEWEKKLEKVQEKFIGQDVKEFVKEKGKFSYLSWAQAWRLFIEHCPSAQYEILMSDKRVPVFGSKTAGWMVFTEIEVMGIRRMMWLPVKNHVNSVVLEPDMMDINTSIMRCLVKNMAMFGLGIEVYGGEDIPEDDGTEKEPKKKKEPTIQMVTNEQWDTIHELGLECGGSKRGILDELEVKSWNKIPLEKGLAYIKQCKKHIADKKLEEK